MDWDLVYGFLIAMAVFAGIWFAIVVPAERRDHERKLALIRKRLEARNKQKNESGGDIKNTDGATE